jgi:hypothetical protein
LSVMSTTDDSGREVRMCVYWDMGRPKIVVRGANLTLVVAVTGLFKNERRIRFDMFSRSGRIANKKD